MMLERDRISTAHAPRSSRQVAITQDDTTLMTFLQAGNNGVGRERVVKSLVADDCEL